MEKWWYKLPQYWSYTGFKDTFENGACTLNGDSFEEKSQSLSFVISLDPGVQPILFGDCNEPKERYRTGLLSSASIQLNPIWAKSGFVNSFPYFL